MIHNVRQKQCRNNKEIGYLLLLLCQLGRCNFRLPDNSVAKKLFSLENGRCCRLQRVFVCFLSASQFPQNKTGLNGPCLTKCNKTHRRKTLKSIALYAPAQVRLGTRNRLHEGPRYATACSPHDWAYNAKWRSLGACSRVLCGRRPFELATYTRPLHQRPG